jgi:hypothetical protein
VKPYSVAVLLFSVVFVAIGVYVLGALFIALGVARFTLERRRSGH